MATGTKAIGFRAEKSALHWAVVEGTKRQPRVQASDILRAPESFSEAASLGWLRTQIINLHDRFAPGVAAVRYPEMLARRSKSADRRCRVEGVILEVSHSRGTEVTTGELATISKNLGTTGAKRYLGQEFRGVSLSSYSKYCQEAILVAVSVLPES